MFRTLAGAAALLCLTSSTALAHWVYVSNEKDDTVSVIDTETNEVVKTFQVGQRPRGITLSLPRSNFGLRRDLKQAHGGRR